MEGVGCLFYITWNVGSRGLPVGLCQFGGQVGWEIHQELHTWFRVHLLADDQKYHVSRIPNDRPTLRMLKPDLRMVSHGDLSTPNHLEISFRLIALIDQMPQPVTYPCFSVAAFHNNTIFQSSQYLAPLWAERLEVTMHTLPLDMVG